MTLSLLIIILVAFVVLGAAIFFAIGLILFKKKEEKSLRSIDLEVLAAESGYFFKTTDPNLHLPLIENHPLKLEPSSINSVTFLSESNYQLTVFEQKLPTAVNLSYDHVTGILLEIDHQHFPNFRINQKGFLARNGFNDGENIPALKLPKSLSENLVVYSDSDVQDAVCDYLDRLWRLEELTWQDINLYEVQASGNRLLFYFEGLLEVDAHYFPTIRKTGSKLFRIFCGGRGSNRRNEQLPSNQHSKRK